MGEGGKSKVKSLVSRPLPTVARVTEKEKKGRNGISLVFQSVRRLRDWSKLATAGVKQHFLLGRSSDSERGSRCGLVRPWLSIDGVWRVSDGLSKPRHSTLIVALSKTLSKVKGSETEGFV